MDLLSSIRKSGSRGGVDFKWEDVSSSVHRENYLGHSLMAPVGRWQKGKDLNWYAKGDSKDSVDGESAEEKRLRERKEEIRRIKEAEEDALAKALGLPVAPRGNGQGSGANNIDIGEMKKMVKETENEDANEETERAGRGVGFGAFVGAGAADTAVLARANDIPSFNPEQGGLVGKDRKESRKSRHERSRSRERHHRKHRHRSRSREGRRHRDRHEDGIRERRHRSRSGERRNARYRDHSENREGRSRRGERERRRSPDWRPRRSRSPDPRDRDRPRDSDYRRR